VTDPSDTLPPGPADDTWPPTGPRVEPMLPPTDTIWYSREHHDDEPFPDDPVVEHSCIGPCSCPVTREEFERKTAGWLT
jgi:hypothetical protein